MKEIAPIFAGFLDTDPNNVLKVFEEAGIAPDDVLTPDSWNDFVVGLSRTYHAYFSGTKDEHDRAYMGLGKLFKLVINK